MSDKARNDIEATARAAARNALYAVGVRWGNADDFDEIVDNAVRSALAHAARGEGVRCWRDAEGTLPARRDGDKVVRVDDVVPAFLDPIPPPATGEASNPGEKEAR